MLGSLQPRTLPADSGRASDSASCAAGALLFSGELGSVGAPHPPTRRVLYVCMESCLVAGRGDGECTQGGYGGGGGGQVLDSNGALLSDFGGGFGCGAGQYGQPENCGSTVDPGAVASFETWLELARKMLTSGECGSGADIVFCGSGGGGGGYSTPVGCTGGFGGGFGFQLSNLAASDAEAPAAVCADEINDPTASVGPAAQLCATQCTSNGAFNACFCPCFKAAVTKAGLPWGASISCPVS